MTGTLIATFILKDGIFLLSDGRLVDSRRGAIASDSFSKVHRLTNKAAMLTAGRHLPNLTQEITEICESNGIVYVDNVVRIAKTVVMNLSNQMYLRINASELIKDIRIFLFVIGFDTYSKPHLYYLDNTSEPPFKIVEKRLFQSGDNTKIEIGSMSSRSGQLEDTSGILRRHAIQARNSREADVNLANMIYTAFTNTKTELSSRNFQIGGKIFISYIDPKTGYKDISSKFR